MVGGIDEARRDRTADGYDRGLAPLDNRHGAARQSSVGD